MALQNHHPVHKHTYTQLGEERNEKHLTVMTKYGSLYGNSIKYTRRNETITNQKKNFTFHNFIFRRTMSNARAV